MRTDVSNRRKFAYDVFAVVRRPPPELYSSDIRSVCQGVENDVRRDLVGGHREPLEIIGTLRLALERVTEVGVERHEHHSATLRVDGRARGPLAAVGPALPGRVRPHPPA